MFRSFRRRNGPVRVFAVALRIHQLDSIPVTNSLVFVRWDLVRKEFSLTPTGRTLLKPIEPGNVVQWNEDFSLDVRIPSDPVDSSVLQPCVVRFCIRSERRRKTGFDDHGIVEIDLADIACDGKVTRSHLTQGSKLNSTLKLTVKVNQLHGNDIFRRPGANPSASPTSSIATGALPASSSLAPGSGLVASSAIPNRSSSGSSPAVEPSVAQARLTPAPGWSFAPTLHQDETPAEPNGQVGDGVGGEDLSPKDAYPRNSSVNDFPHAHQVHIPRRHGKDGCDSAGGKGPLLHVSASVPLFSDGHHGKLVHDTKLPYSVSPGSQEEASSAWESHGSGGLPATQMPRTPPISSSAMYVDSMLGSGDALLLQNSRSPLAASSTIPLSPRSPSGSVSAAAVLEYLVPEAVQELVYEEVRLGRVRSSFAPHIVASRVPVSTVLDHVFQGLGHLDLKSYQDCKPDSLAVEEAAAAPSFRGTGSFEIGADLHVPMVPPLFGPTGLSTSRSTPGISSLY